MQGCGGSRLFRHASHVARSRAGAPDTAHQSEGESLKPGGTAEETHPLRPCGCIAQPSGAFFLPEGIHTRRQPIHAGHQTDSAKSPGAARRASRARNKDISIDEFLAQDEKRRTLMAQVEEKKALRNAESKKIGEIKKRGRFRGGSGRHHGGNAQGRRRDRRLRTRTSPSWKPRWTLS